MHSQHISTPMLLSIIQFGVVNVIIDHSMHGNRNLAAVVGKQPGSLTKNVYSYVLADLNEK